MFAFAVVQDAGKGGGAGTEEEEEQALRNHAGKTSLEEFTTLRTCNNNEY